MSDPALIASRRAAYLAAEAATDNHTAHCGTCAGGGSCADADSYMDTEYRRAEDLRAADSYALRRYDRASWPTEG